MILQFVSNGQCQTGPRREERTYVLLRLIGVHVRSIRNRELGVAGALDVDGHDDVVRGVASGAPGDSRSSGLGSD